MNRSTIIFIAAAALCDLGCSKHHPAEDAMISLHLTDANESTTMEVALTSFAVKNNFNSKIYSDHEKDSTDPYKPFTVEYENPALKGFNVMKFENRTLYPKETGGCLMVSIVADDRNVDLKSLLKQLTDV